MLGKGETLDEAYNNLLNKKTELVQEFEELGILDELPDALPRKVSRSLREPEGLLNFFIKTLVVVVVAFVFIGFGVKELKKQGEIMKKEISQAGAVFKNEITKIKTLRLGRRLGHELEKGANHEISPERQEELIKNIRVLVQRYKPILDELSPLFSGDGATH